MSAPRWHGAVGAGRAPGGGHVVEAEVRVRGVARVEHAREAGEVDAPREVDALLLRDVGRYRRDIGEM